MKAKSFVVVLVFLSGACCFAEPERDVTITGLVVDYQAQPVRDAEVVAYEEFYNSETSQRHWKNLGGVTKTDLNGHFILSTRACALYNVFIVARKKGLATGWDSLDTKNEQGIRYHSNIILEKPSVLAGKLVNANGKPVARAKIHAVPMSNSIRHLVRSPVYAQEQWFTTETDVGGNFMFDNLALDILVNFWVKASGWNLEYMIPDSDYYRASSYKVGQTDARLVLPTEVPVHGRVVDTERHNPVADVSLEINPDYQNKNPYRPQLVVSGQDGRFSIKGVPVGKHFLEVVAPKEKMVDWVGKRISLDINEGLVPEDVTIKVEKGRIIEIVIRDEVTQEPLPDVFVSSVSFDSGFYQDSSSDANGIVRFHVPTDDELSEIDIYDTDDHKGWFEAIFIRKDRNKPFEFQLERVHRISGIVFDEYGQSVPGAILNVCYYYSNKVGITDTLGKFNIGVIFDLDRKYLFVRHIERNLAAIVYIKGDSESIKVELKPALSIFGQITNANGEGIPAARVLLCDKRENVLLEALTDPTGRYEMTAVPPEQKEFVYLISVEASGYGPVENEPFSIKGEPGIPVKMKTISLQPTDRSVSGVVVNTRGEPVAGVPVVLSGKGQPRRSTMSDDNGRFIINRICKGQCRLEAHFEDIQSGKVVVQVEAGDQNIKIVSKR